VLAINGPIPNVPAGGLLPTKTIDNIKSIIAPPLKGRIFKDTDDPATSFNCQDFTEWAENAYRPLTVTTIHCHLICKRSFYVPGIQSPWKSKDAFGHTFNDYHQNGMIYFFDPQSHWLPRLYQLDLDLNRDGVISAVEVGPARDFDPALLDDFDQGCSGEALVLCNNLSFDDRQHAYEYYNSRGMTCMDPAKLTRSKDIQAKAPLAPDAPRY
jgi:hypothetical protein